MARSVEEIKEVIKTEIRTYSEFDNFLFPEDGGSSVSIFNLIIFVTAATTFVFEVIMDNLKTEVTEIANRAPSGNESWVRRQILNFQYGDVITINTTDATADDYFEPKYDVVDTTKRIVTQCAVFDNNTDIAIKVGKGDAGSVTALTSTELAALENYYYGTSSTEGIGFAGVTANFVNLESDRMRVEATVHYLGQYVEATVKTNVISAIDAFFASFTDENFGGNVYMNKLVDAIQAVEGVSRVKLADIKGRAETVVLGSATAVDTQGVYETSAGHIIAEDTASNTLDDTITMTEEDK